VQMSAAAFIQVRAGPALRAPALHCARIVLILRALPLRLTGQTSATHTQGLLDLEGSSLTPILVSLVQKDASMLDAFGKVRVCWS